MLHRHSGDIDNPRILGTFNEPIDDWLSFFMFTYFTDRDGKYQLKSLAESGFDPLARTCRFMLTEEAHHMFVGETGIGRIVKRTLAEMAKLGSDDPDALRRAGVLDLPLLQRYINFWYSSSLDLFGSEMSSNAATYFANGLKGRPDEDTFADHDVEDAIETLDTPDGPQEVRARNASEAAISPARTATLDSSEEESPWLSSVGPCRYTALRRAGTPRTRWSRPTSSAPSASTAQNGRSPPSRVRGSTGR